MNKTLKQVEQTPALFQTKQQSSFIHKKKLPVIPLAVLLPQIGNVSDLQRVSTLLSQKLKNIQEEKTAKTEGLTKDKALEESMLTQAMTWLSLGAEGEE